MCVLYNTYRREEGQLQLVSNDDVMPSSQTRCAPSSLLKYLRFVFFFFCFPLTSPSNSSLRPLFASPHRLSVQCFLGRPPSAKLGWMEPPSSASSALRRLRPGDLSRPKLASDAHVNYAGGVLAARGSACTFTPRFAVLEASPATGEHHAAPAGGIYSTVPAAAREEKRINKNQCAAAVAAAEWIYIRTLGIYPGSAARPRVVLPSGAPTPARALSCISPGLCYSGIYSGQTLAVAAVNYSLPPIALFFFLILTIDLKQIASCQSRIVAR